MAAPRALPAAILLALSILAFPAPSSAQVTPELQPGDTIRFVGADVHASSSPSCVLAATTCACFNLRKAVRVASQRYDEALRPAGLRSTQFVMLLAIRMLGTAEQGRVLAASAVFLPYDQLPGRAWRGLRP